MHLPNKGTLNPVEHLSLSLLPLQLLPLVSGPCTHYSHPEASRAFPVLFVAPDSHNPAALPEKPAEYPLQWFVPGVAVSQEYTAGRIMCMPVCAQSPPPLRQSLNGNAIEALSSKWSEGSVSDGRVVTKSDEGHSPARRRSDARSQSSDGADGSAQRLRRRCAWAAESAQACMLNLTQDIT